MTSSNAGPTRLAGLLRETQNGLAKPLEFFGSFCKVPNFSAAAATANFSAAR